MSANVPNVVAVIGATGSGKSYWLKNLLRSAPPRRLMIWDAMREYGAFGSLAVTPQQLLAIAQRAGKNGELAAVYQPDKSTQEKIDKQFAFFCGMAIALGDCAVIVEELSQVTKPGFSPPRWRDVVTQGRHDKLTIIATSQRPALVDKTFFSNATMIRCGKLGATSDKRTMADALDIDLATVRGLNRLQWLVRDDAGKISRDDIVIAPARAARAARARKPAARAARRQPAPA